MQERPVTSAVPDNPYQPPDRLQMQKQYQCRQCYRTVACEDHDNGKSHGSKEEEAVDAKCGFEASTVLFTDQKCLRLVRRCSEAVFAIKMNFVIVDIVISSLIVCDYELTNIKYFISVILLLNVNQRIF